MCSCLVELVICTPISLTFLNFHIVKNFVIFDFLFVFQALKLLEEIREQLNSLLLPQHTKLKQNIMEVLDVELIKQQAEKGILDFPVSVYN